MTGMNRSAEFLNDLIEKRRQLIDALDANKGEVNLDIFEDFYPDRAHFVYELLQNAEDAGATEVTFTLDRDRLVCEHDGRRRFTEQDVSAITGIHNSKKGNVTDQIGKFGVGFKSVFVYTQAPTVRSGDFAFRIVKLILPEPIAPDPSIGSHTRFEFPFDNPNKLPKDAYAEIAAGLDDLDETTLLFLTNLQAIRWKTGDVEGHVLRQAHTDTHIEIVKRTGSRTIARSHFLKFGQAVEGLGTHRVAIAFPLEFLAGVQTFDADKPLAQQMRIVPASQGRVAVFFTAAKETSGLLFHLHGPFVPELSRASIKETASNEPLFAQLAALSAQSLHAIRDLRLLTPEFLAVLPNPEDQIPPRYQPIRAAILNEMKTEPLTPTHDRSHAPGAQLIQARASLKSLLSKEDLAFLVTHEGAPPLWAVGVTQRSSRIDNFLGGLSIKDWAADAFVGILEKKATTGSRYTSLPPYWVIGPDEAFMAWLGQKPLEWLQQFYALLHDEGPQTGLHRLKNLKIVRLRDGNFGVAAQSFFANDQTGDRIATVEPLVYTSGRSKPAQEKAKKFLSDLGVRELGEAEEIELILKARYTKDAEIPDDKTYLRDFKRFVALVEEQPAMARLFGSFYVFQGEDGGWYTPSDIYLDEPYKHTDLAAYHNQRKEDERCTALHPRYKDCGIANKRIVGFAEAVGAVSALAIVEGYCHHNPQWAHLRSVGGDRATSPIDRDYHIPNMVELLRKPSIGLSRLLWRTLIAIPSGSVFFQAVYQRNNSWGSRTVESRLVHELRAAKWVPQRDGQFVRPADAVRQLLPEGFPFDAGNAGLRHVQFGVEVTRQATQEEQKESFAKKAGFTDAAAMERGKRFAALPPEEQERFFEERERSAKAAIPDRAPINPEQRSRNVAEQAAGAPDKTSEIRARSVSIGLEDVKAEANQYLRQHYRNRDGEMTCQICQGPLPFKLDDGTEYFEVVEFLPELKKRHFQNYLALCPNHAAMYMHANASKGFLCDAMEELEGGELTVTLAQQEMTIYISEIHRIDIKAVIAAEKKFPPDEEDERAA